MKLVINGETVEIPSGGSESSGDIYSTEETRIGTWIDGKPLYRISNQYDTSNVDLDTAIILQDLAALNMDLVTSITATINTSAAVYPIPFVREIVSAGTLTQLTVISLSSKRLIFRTTSENFRGTLLTTIEYTKTTDTATTQL